MNDNSHNQSPGAPIAAIAAPGDIEPPQGINVSEGGNSQKVTAADLVPQRTGLLATARDPRTQMPAAELRPDTLVTVGRVPMRLAVAERLGFVRRASTDEYVEVDAAERADKADKAKQEQEAKREAEGAFPAPLNQEASDALTDLAEVARRSGSSLESLYIGALVNADTFKAQTVPHIARASGVSPEALQGAVESVVRGIGEQAGNLARQGGVDPERFGAWLFDQPARNWIGAVIRAVSAKDGSGFRALLSRYVQSHPEDSRATGTETAKVFKDHRGREYVQVKLPDGRDMAVSLATARRMKLL